MFNTTHTLVGVAIARAGTDKWAPKALATAVIASNFPDIDSIAGFWGTAAYLDHHRGITHSLIGVPIFALAVAVVMFLFSEKFWRTYAIALIAMATHPALDYLNPYGVRPFLPWNRKWYYGDVVFIIDPYLDLILLFGILIGIWAPKLRRAATWSSLAFAALYIGARVELHTMAVSNLMDRLARVPNVTKSAVLPQMMSPALWDAVVETREITMKFPISAFTNAVFTDDRVVRLRRETANEIVIESAATAPSAAALLRFARFPITRVAASPSGYRVMFIDFRFYGGNPKAALASEVTLDPSMRITEEQLSFVREIN